MPSLVGTLRIPLDDHCFDNVGRLPDGSQFMAFVTGAFPLGFEYYLGDDWREKKQWLAVLHRFDRDGNHIGSESRLGGYDIEGRDVAGTNAWNALEEMYAVLAARGTPEFCDIHVKPFSVVLDGVYHRLVYEHHLEEELEFECVMLQPRDIMFHPPWDSGEYST